MFRCLKHAGEGVKREDPGGFADTNALDSEFFQDTAKVQFITVELAGSFGDGCDSKIFKHVVDVFWWYLRVSATVLG